MYSQEATVAAVLAFYQQIVKHPYLDESALKTAPENGWDTIDVPTLCKKGKNDTVINLLRHLPYLFPSDPHDSLLIQYETKPICYAGNKNYNGCYMDEVNPLPGHCVYLTEGVGREGYSLILDTQTGKVYPPDVDGMPNRYKRHGYRIQHHWSRDQLRASV